MSLSKLISELAESLFAKPSVKERTHWSGRDGANGVRWTVTGSGDDWTLRKNGVVLAEYRTAERTEEYVEVASGDERMRLHADRMLMNEKSGWVLMARGRWCEPEM